MSCFFCIIIYNSPKEAIIVPVIRTAALESTCHSINGYDGLHLAAANLQVSFENEEGCASNESACLLTWLGICSGPRRELFDLLSVEMGQYLFSKTEV
jgi:hypothetical protein